MEATENSPCWDCGGTRAVPDDFGLHEDCYAPCPSCVVAWDDAPEWPDDDEPRHQGAVCASLSTTSRVLRVLASSDL